MSSALSTKLKVPPKSMTCAPIAANTGAWLTPGTTVLVSPEGGQLFCSSAKKFNVSSDCAAILTLKPPPPSAVVFTTALVRALVMVTAAPAFAVFAKPSTMELPLAGMVTSSRSVLTSRVKGIRLMITDCDVEAPPDKMASKPTWFAPS